MGLVVRVTGLKKRRCRAGRRTCESSARHRKTCLISSMLSPAGTSNMICCRIVLARGLYPGSGTRRVHVVLRAGASRADSLRAHVVRGPSVGRGAGTTRRGTRALLRETEVENDGLAERAIGIRG